MATTFIVFLYSYPTAEQDSELYFFLFYIWQIITLVGPYAALKPNIKQTAIHTCAALLFMKYLT